MDYLNVTTEELRGIDTKELLAAEKDVRKQLAELRMDIYTAPTVNSGKARKLKKTLARVLTVRHEKKQVAQAE